MSNRLEDLEVYTLSEQFSDEIWFIVLQWEYFVKDTLGKQLTRSADSIGATLQRGSDVIIIKKIRTSVTLAAVHS